MDSEAEYKGTKATVAAVLLMGWGNCGDDSNGRPIGYNAAATCDDPECKRPIDRGLSYACGDMHGEDEFSCGKYYCADHRSCWVLAYGDHFVTVCDTCQVELLESGNWVEDELEGVLKRVES